MKTIPPAAQQSLLDWYRDNGRDLPWRRTRDPYRIMVSEIMLQQTQVERVIPKYHEFLARFPTLEALATAPASKVIRAWAGLGYNRRALNLQRAARAVIENYGGEMPRTVDDLRKLPGIGAYTAGAIACFAFDQGVGFVDTNIRRVLHRVTAGPDVPEPQLTNRQIERLAAGSVPAGEAHDWNQALIDLGATICRARSTDCQACPLAPWCAARPVIQDVLAAVQSTRVQRRGIAPAEPFEQTSRYFRGRIVALLRDARHSLTASQLARAIKPDEATDDWITPYITGLVRDGLIAEAVESGVRENPVRYDGETPQGEIRYRLPD